MINIRQEVANTLELLYPSNVIYVEDIQNFVPSNFYVKIVSGSHKKESHTRYKRTYSVDVQYFGSTNVECDTKSDELYETMEYLINNYARGTNMHHEIIDKVLHFYVDYTIRLNKDVESIPKMNDVEVNEHAIY